MKNCTITVDLAGLEAIIEPVYLKRFAGIDRAVYALIANSFKLSPPSSWKVKTDSVVIKATHGGDPVACANWANGHHYLDGKPRITITVE